MKTIKPNTVLPKGAVRINPALHLELGHYRHQDFDAKVTISGVTWYRVKGGFGELGDREDWVADLKHVGPSLSDYSFREPRWGTENYASFEAGANAKLSRALQRAQEKIAEAQKLIDELKPVCRQLTAALKK